MRRRKLAMIGIDAGDRRFIEAHASALPHLTRVCLEGAVTDLATSSELLTGSVWPTFYTGCSPGEHGFYHHLQWDPEQMRIRRVAADWLYSEPFWYALAREGYSVAVLDVPMTFPSRLDRGIEVINWGSHDQLGVFHSNRPEVARAIRTRFGRHPMGPEIPVDKTRRQLQRIRDNLVRGAARKGALIRWLLESQEWDFFLAAFGECHRGGHILWPEDRPGSVIPEHALLDVYRAVDEALGSVLPLLERTAVTLVLFALHGMESNRAQEHFVPGIMDRVNCDFRGDGGAAAARPGQRSLMRFLRSALPARLQHAVARAVPVAVRDWVV
ncbi:MAG: alkaline phosphatase family protein, partial [Pseudomonadota bacterium]